jgi:hypothetical protein
VPWLAVAALVVGGPRLASPGVRLQVGGAVESTDEGLDVRVDITNKGDVAAATVDVRAELGDEVDQRPVDGGVAAGATHAIVFRFAGMPSPPGIHVLGLRLDYTEAAAPGRAAGSASQRAYLLLALGANPPAAVTVSAGESTLETLGAVRARVTSADGAAHRVRLRVLTPRGLNANTPVEVEVPASGAVEAQVPVLRGTVPRPSQHGVVVVAEVVGAPLAQAAVATTLVHVSGDPALMPRLRRPIAAAAVLLLLAAGILERRAYRRRNLRPPTST